MSDPPTPAEAAELARTVFDLVNLTSPAGWSKAIIDCVRAGDRAVVSVRNELDPLAIRSERLVESELGYDPGMRMAWLAGVLARLDGVVFGVGAETTASAILRRGSGTAQLELIPGGGGRSRAIALSSQDLEQVLLSDALLEAIARAEKRFAPLRKDLDAWLSRARRWDYDFDAHLLRFTTADGSAMVAPAAIVGTWGRGSVVPRTFLWSWANATLKDRLSPALGSLAEKTRLDRGTAIFREQDPLLCEEALAYRFAQAAADRIAARGLMAPVSNTVHYYIAILGDPTATRP
jgi:hypothetical protein